MLYKKNITRLVAISLAVLMLPYQMMDVKAEEVFTLEREIADSAYDMLLEELTSEVDESKEYAEDRVLVFLENQGLAELKACADTVSDNGLTELIAEVESDDMQFACVDIEDMSVQEAVDYYSDLPGVGYVQPDYLYDLDEYYEGEMESASTYYNDPYVRNQWYLDKLGVEAARELLKTHATSKVRVAIVDTGIDLSHPDLQKNVNPAYCVSSTTTQYLPITTDLGSTGHGTHIAGIIGATSNNGIGVAGIADDYAEIMAIRCQDERGMYSSYAVNGIRYAVNNGAKVINMSFGMTSADRATELALQYAYDANVMCVCSAGNTGGNEKHYPSAYDTAIGIINVTRDNVKSSGSSYGTDDFISAPGTSIYSTLPGGTYGSKNGTSMAAGVATGTIALLYALEPTLTVEQVKSIMSQTATDIYSPGFDEMSGWGIINAEAMIADYSSENATTVYGFVTRMYRKVLNRVPDPEGRAYYIKLLQSKTRTGADVASSFLESKEFTSRQMTDDEYLEILYRTFMGRNPDEEGRQYWLYYLRNGMSRIWVADCFCNSAEFKNICAQCGIAAGRVRLRENRDRNVGLTGFFARQYTKAQGRQYDVEGLNYWTGVVLDGKMSMMDAATDGFFHSKEFMSHNYSDRDFLAILYRTFFDREYDEEGMQYWLNLLSSHKASRDEVIYCFYNSKEFKAVRARYGF